MSGSKRPPSITYKFKEKEASFDPGDSVLQGDASTARSEKRKQSKLNVESKRPEILSTTELISAVGQIWDRVNPVFVSESKEKLNCSRSGCRRNVVLGAKDVRVEAVKDDDASYFSVDVRSGSNVTSWVQPKLEFISVAQKMSMIESCCRSSFVRPSVLQFLRGNNNVYSNESWKGKGLATLGFSYDMERIYGWMKDIISVESPYPVNATKVIEDKKTDKICIPGSTIGHPVGCVPTDATPAKDNFLSTNTNFS